MSRTPALPRLEACKQELLTGDPSAAADSDALQCKLGAVCGCQGDCHRNLGAFGPAADLYAQSADHLRRCDSDNKEVRL